MIVQLTASQRDIAVTLGRRKAKGMREAAVATVDQCVEASLERLRASAETKRRRLRKRVIRALAKQGDANNLPGQLSTAFWDAYVQDTGASAKQQVSGLDRATLNPNLALTLHTHTQVKTIRKNIALLVDFFGLKRKRWVA